VHVPAGLYVRTVFALTQLLCGGALQIVSCVWYVHVPPPQVPGLPKTRLVVALTPAAAAGVVQVMPAQGSVLHTPPVQPFAHTVSVGAYEQVPLAQLPEGAKVRRVAPTQVAAGGVLQAVSVAAYVHVPPAQVPVAA